MNPMMGGIPPNAPPSSVPLPPPPIPQPAPPPKFTPAFIAYADEYARWWMKQSHEAVRTKMRRWQLLEDITFSRRKLSDWHRAMSAAAEDWRKVGNAGWQADFIAGSAPVVQSFADRLFGALFSQDQYCRVVLEPTLSSELPNHEDPDYSTSQKFQALLMQKNREAFFKTRTYTNLWSYALYGTSIAKKYYITKERHQWIYDPATGQRVPQTLRKEFPLSEIVPLDMALPDWAASHSDCQLWTGIGNRLLTTVAAVRNSFAAGNYYLNRDKFDKLFPVDEGATIYQMERHLYDDPQSTWIPDVSRTARLCVWEVHLEIPIPPQISKMGGTQECICTFVTRSTEDDPTSALMIRCDPGPALETGDRPYLVSHFTPLPGTWGMGAVEPALDLIWYLSSLINTTIDNARMSTDVMLKMRRGSRPWIELNRKKGDLVYPGKVWDVDDPSDVTPFEPLQFPSQAIINIQQYLGHMYEQKTTVSEATLGISGREKTASEAYMLGQMGDLPLNARLQLFVENHFEPDLKLSLAMLQRRLRTGQIVNMPDWTGAPRIPREMTLAEIRTGTYRVMATMNRPDQTQMARMQSLERTLPILLKDPEAEMSLLRENTLINRKGILKQYFTLAGDADIEHTLQEVDEKTKQERMMMLMPPPPPQPGLSPGAGPQSPNGPPEALPPGGGPPPQLGMNGTPMGETDNTDQGVMSALMQMAAQARQAQGVVQ